MRERLEQFRQAWQLAVASNPRLPWFVFGPAALVIAATIAIAVLLDMWWVLPIGITLGILVGTVIFGRAAQSAQYAEIEGRPGAAAAVLQVMRGQWFVTPAVAFSKKQDFVHRVVGRCGVVLVAEGSPTRLKQLVAKERRRMQRIVGETPVHVLVVGTREHDVSLQGLQTALNKLPRKLGKSDVPRLARELEALDPGLPMPKGYIPNQGRKMR
jgi:hypothetical protein